mmetsp:Transcript_1008/g.3151  ORF Transcript_1008/g.3151 Transcript_1008/m.3151 type:complete len:137 (-) Transcript_1008:40-450(-)
MSKTRITAPALALVVLAVVLVVADAVVIAPVLQKPSLRQLSNCFPEDDPFLCNCELAPGVSDGCLELVSTDLCEFRDCQSKYTCTCADTGLQCSVSFVSRDVLSATGFVFNPPFGSPVVGCSAQPTEVPVVIPIDR